jgi:hypothetical protein
MYVLKDQERKQLVVDAMELYNCLLS